MTESKPLASKWGSNIEMGALPEWSHQFVAENVLYTRSFLGSNAGALKSDGSIDLNSPTPWVIPKDIRAVVASSASTGSSSSSSPAASETASTASKSALDSGSYFQSAGFATSAPKILVTTIVTLGMFLRL